MGLVFDIFFRRKALKNGNSIDKSMVCVEKYI